MRLSKVASVALAPLTMAAITIPTAASASAAIPTVAGFGLQQRLDDVGGPDTGPDPNFWNGGEAGGGAGPADAGPDTGTGPGIWNGGEAAGAV
jgi:hypothetical protein